MAESVLGPRDSSKKIYQPQFADSGPHIRNTPSQDGAFVELGRDSECSWPEAIFEMAHETVHLLNPIRGNANNLEEGVAVSFSLHVQPAYNICVRPAMEEYVEVLRLVKTLPGDPLGAARRVRERVGALSEATAADLQELFPDVDGAVLNKLVEKFARDSD